MAIQLVRVTRKDSRLVGFDEKGNEHQLGKLQERSFRYYSHEHRQRQLNTLRTHLIPGYFMLREPERKDSKESVQPYVYYFSRK